MTDIQELLQQARELPPGPERLALLDEAIRLADLQNDAAAGYQVREEMIDSASDAGQSDRMLSAFAWCRAHADAHPEEFGGFMLLWRQKWVVRAAMGFPQVPLARVQELLDDYAARLQAAGHGERSLHNYRLNLMYYTGDRVAAAREFQLWQESRRDSMSNCHACELNAVAHYYAFMGDDQQSVQHAEQLIRSRMGCAHVPHSTLGAVLAPLLRLGRWADAEKYHQRGRRMVADKPNHLPAQANHLAYLALVRPGKAQEWYARHLPWAEQTNDLEDRLHYHMAAALLFSELQRAGRKTVSLTLPQQVPGFQPAGKYSVQERFDHHHGEALRIAALFDARGGSDEFTRMVGRTLALAELPRPVRESAV